MAQNEVEVWTQVGLPMLGAAGVRYTRTWQDRGNELAVATSEAAGIEMEELDEQLEQNEPARDVFARALGRAVQVGDDVYRGTLGRLVAAALDDAKIDAVAYLMSELVKLEPVHLRALLLAFRFHPEPPEPEVERPLTPEEMAATEPLKRPQMPGPELPVVDIADATYAVGVRVEAHFLEEEFGLDPGVSAAILGSLGAAGFLSSNETTAPHPTPWAKSALMLMFPQIQSIG